MENFPVAMEEIISKIKLEQIEVETYCAESPEYSGVSTQSTKDVPLLLRCRLCALPNHNMVDIFSPYETGEDIVEHIKYCLRIVVTKSDALPKKACRACLEELELCYQFNKIVAKAEQQLLALNRETSDKLAELGSNCQSSLKCNEAVHANIESQLQPASGVVTEDKSSTFVKEELITDATVDNDLVLAVLQPFTGAWLPLNANGATILTTDQNEEAESDKHENQESSMNQLDAERVSTPQISQQSTCDSGKNNMSDSRLQVEEKQMLRPHCGEKLETSRIKEENPAVPVGRDTKGRELRCSICSKTYARKDSLARHTKFHTGEGLHSCNFCEKKFPTGSERNRHHLTHTNGGRYKCIICRMTFSALSVLKVHATTDHSDVKDYPFSTCKISYNRSKARKGHMSIHTDERLLWCKYCRKDFKSKGKLQYHLRNCKKRHHAKNGATFTTYNGLHTHKKLYNCEYCEKKFVTRFSRDRHRHVHTIEKPFKCSVCEETFAWIETLYDHLAIHTVDEKGTSFSFVQ